MSVEGMVIHMVHPAERIKGSKSNLLEGKRIILGITGSIGAVECVRLARELIRHGADVIAVMTESAKEILSPESMFFATGKPPITKLGGGVEHVTFAGEEEAEKSLLLIAPATANTIGKIATGIDDTPVTTFATVALGSGMPILIAPAMHAAMYRNPAVVKNIEYLKELGVEFIPPREEEGKEKFPDVETVFLHVLRAFRGGPGRGEAALVIGGASEEPIDEMRVVSNRSTGKTASEIAKALFVEGFEVALLWGRTTTPPPKVGEITGFRRVEELIELLEKMKGREFHFIFMPAALSDFIPESREGKIPSGGELLLRMRSAPKVLNLLRELFPSAHIVAFKAVGGDDRKVMEREALSYIKEGRADFVAANMLKDVKEESTRITLYWRDGALGSFEGDKFRVATALVKAVMEKAGG
ncbi:MAG: bifunctional phosphopantothenoylcysteine decarboxylase/phosphopantothenate--cysteine ligase CoaBC [Thermoplasmata archaeon]|nr:MAG: bifunctional phosphopantothenoylcysteine decarboxylase/phosphopantothenate--cysteine ligase CoaBC [Thermoplasmata archaeon]